MKAYIFFIPLENGKILRVIYNMDLKNWLRNKNINTTAIWRIKEIKQMPTDKRDLFDLYFIEQFNMKLTTQPIKKL